MKERKINIDHQLQRHSDIQYEITDTKTNAGTSLSLTGTGASYSWIRIAVQW